jgi:hypothetical protein
VGPGAGRNLQSLTARPTTHDLVLRRPEGASKDVPEGSSGAVSAIWSILRGPLLSQRAPQMRSRLRIGTLTIEDFALGPGERLRCGARG